MLVENLNRLPALDGLFQTLVHTRVAGRVRVKDLIDAS